MRAGRAVNAETAVSTSRTVARLNALHRPSRPNSSPCGVRASSKPSVTSSNTSPGRSCAEPNVPAADPTRSATGPVGSRLTSSSEVNVPLPAGTISGGRCPAFA